MQWNKFLAGLDEVRGEIRASRDVKKGVIPTADALLTKLDKLIIDARREALQRELTTPLDDGLFATAGEGPIVVPDSVVEVIKAVAAAEPKAAKSDQLTITPVPRQTFWIDREPVLTEREKDETDE